MEKMERLINLEITERGTIIEEIGIVCGMTGFRLRLLAKHWAMALTLCRSRVRLANQSWRPTAHIPEARQSSERSVSD